jgi:hypothetical protein
LWFLISKRPKEDLKRLEFFAALRRHKQREGGNPLRTGGLHACV